MAEGFGRCRRQRNRTQLVPVAIKLCASLALGHRLFQGCCSLHKVAELLVERFLANERRSLLDTITARALPRLMLVTRHEHRGVLDHLNQAHLGAARQAQHLRKYRRQRNELWCLREGWSSSGKRYYLARRAAPLALPPQMCRYDEGISPLPTAVHFHSDAPGWPHHMARSKMAQRAQTLSPQAQPQGANG